jgi:hypothetical protein
MRNILNILIYGSLLFMAACSSPGEKIYNVEELNTGDSIGDFTIKSISPNEHGGIKMVLDGKIIIKDTLDRAPINYLGVKNTILSGKIKFGDDTLDLGRNKIYFQNPSLLALYFDENMIEETPDGKTTFSGGFTAEFVLTDIQIELRTRDLITAKISNVLAFNGKQNPEIKEPMLVKLKYFFENQLIDRVNTLAGQEPFKDGLFFPNDITEFQMYKKNEAFRNFVDEILNYGFGIEQAEGMYYLYVGEPANYQDGEVSMVPETMTAEDLKEAENFGGLKVNEFNYSPKELLSVTFTGGFEVEGQLYFDEMWSEIGFTADEGSPYTTELKVDGLSFKTMHNQTSNTTVN